MLVSTIERPRARARTQQPPLRAVPALRVPRNEFIRQQEVIVALESDWLWQIASPEGRRQLLIEHGLEPR